MKTSVNVNDYVIVTLTKEGWFVFRDYYINRGLDPEPYIKMANRNVGENQIKIQLYDLMYIFGKQMYMGNNKQIFIENKLEIVTS